MNYEFKTNAWLNYSLTEEFECEPQAIRELGEQLFAIYKTNYVYLTDLVIATNWKIWDWYEKNEAIARVYNELWERFDEYAMEHLQGEEMRYFLAQTD